MVIISIIMLMLMLILIKFFKWIINLIFILLSALAINEMAKYYIEQQIKFNEVNMISRIFTYFSITNFCFNNEFMKIKWYYIFNYIFQIIFIKICLFK